MSPRPTHSFYCGFAPMLGVRIYRTASDMYAAIFVATGKHVRAICGCCVSNARSRDGTVLYLNEGQLNLSTIVHEVTHAGQEYILARQLHLREENDRETHAHWVASAVEDIVAILLHRGYRWAPKRSRGAIFNLGLNLTLKKP